MKKSILLSVFALAILAGCGNNNVNKNLTGVVNTGADEMMNDDLVMTGSESMTGEEEILPVNDMAPSENNMIGSNTGVVKDKPEAYKLNIPNCDKYVKLMECVIDKIPAGKRTETIDQYEQVIKLRNGFSGADLKAICDQTIDSLQSSSGSFNQIGCKI